MIVTLKKESFPAESVDGSGSCAGGEPPGCYVYPNIPGNFPIKERAIAKHAKLVLYSSHLLLKLPGIEVQNEFARCHAHRIDPHLVVPVLPRAKYYNTRAFKSVFEKINSRSNRGYVAPDRKTISFAISWGNA